MADLMELRRWTVRRIQNLKGHLPRNTPKRSGIFGFITSLVFLYFILNWTYRPNNKIASTHHCIDEFLQRKGVERPPSWMKNNNGVVGENWQKDDKLAFTGNGFIGLEAVLDGSLILFANESGRSNLHTGFYPLIDVQSPMGVIEERAVFVDKSAIVHTVRCSILSDKCVCIGSSVYAHRTRPGLLVQDVQVVNPSSSAFTLSFKRKITAEFKQKESQTTPIYTKTFGEGKKKVLLAVACSKTPNMAISVKPKVEENFRFLCHSARKDHSEAAESGLVSQVASDFAQLLAINSERLDREHLAGWQSLNSANFEISHSKAPNSLNQPDVDTARNLLLSSVPILAANADQPMSSSAANCFTGISTMLTPSKLWQKPADLRALLHLIDIWRTTLDHRGCANLIRRHGAHGFAQAFLLSLAAGTFSNGAKRLEFGLNPETELQRDIKVNGLRLGYDGLVSLHFQLDPTLKPFVIIQNGNPSKPIFACTAGCQEAPHLVGKEPVSLAIKMTQPSSSILFLSDQSTELELLKKTLHVIEVFDAPAHAQGRVDLHRHGNARNSEGLPTIFWVLLVLLLIIFHLFLFKLLYSEWRNSSSVPYSKFNKKVLFRR